MQSEVSVVIVGAGPVGLLLAYQLSKFGIKDYIIFDKRDNIIETYGRACSIWPRTIELWDQLDLMEDMFAAGGVTSSTGYNFRDGKVVPGGLSFAHNMDRIGNTAFKFCFHLRQGMIEKVLRDKLKAEYGVEVYGHCELFELNDRTLDGADHGKRSSTNHPVALKFKNAISGQTHEVDARYVIGTDWGHSTVRKLSGIPFIGTKSGATWVRMDAEVETNMPSPRCLNSVQSPTHGLVLFCPIDDNLTRIGYVFSPALQRKWDMRGNDRVGEPGGSDGVEGSLQKEFLMAEAKQAVKPFTLDFKRVDWYTIYGIGQCFAETFIKGRIILAGDACHTHSSGSAQGLKTGAQDAINLAWKITSQLRSPCYRPTKILESYNKERQYVARQVIENDATIAALTSGYHPQKYAHRKDEDPRELLREWCENMENLQFTLGLGVAYPSSHISWQNGLDSFAISNALPGQRAPDGSLIKLGTDEFIRLHSVLPITGSFHIIVFAGNSQKARAKQGYAHFRSDMDSDNSFAKQIFSALFTIRFLTIVTSSATDASELFSHGMPIGRVYLDNSRKTHDAYGIDCDAGGVVLLRPDGYIATVVSLDEQTNMILKSYFQSAQGPA